MMFSLKLTMEPAAPPQFAAVVQVAFGKSTKRYSALAVQFCAKATSSPGADRPARLDRTVESGWRIEASLNIAESGAGSAVEEDAVEGIADPAADRGEPLALRLARNGRRYDCGDGSASRTGIAMKVGPVAVALDAEDVVG